MNRAILTALLVISVSAQTPANNHPKKTLAPPDKLRAAATAAYNAELAREKAPECPDAHNTYDINMCLGHEWDLTDANYKAFITALRTILSTLGESTPYDGPTGQTATAATNTAAFDVAEAAWQNYAKAECSAVDTLWRGGTIVNAMVGECVLRVARSRMHELDIAYEMELHPH